MGENSHHISGGERDVPPPSLPGPHRLGKARVGMFWKLQSTYQEEKSDVGGGGGGLRTEGCLGQGYENSQL